MARLRIDQVVPGVGVLTWTGRWWTEPGAVDHLLTALAAAFGEGYRRVEAEVPVTEPDLRRTLQRAGMRPEGRARGRAAAADGTPVDAVRLARLAGDPEPGTRPSFLGVLNATLPTKRVIGQGLVRNERGEVLLCELTYKAEWDLPGGVVDPRESPSRTVVREIAEELAVELPEGRLAAVNWLPPYRQWDDAVLCVFDLGVHPGLLDGVVLQASEIRGVHWCHPDDLDAHVAPYVARHLRSVLAADAEAGPLYLEDGLPPQWGGAGR